MVQRVSQLVVICSLCLGQISAMCSCNISLCKHRWRMSIIPVLSPKLSSPPVALPNLSQPIFFKAYIYLSCSKTTGMQTPHTNLPGMIKASSPLTSSLVRSLMLPLAILALSTSTLRFSWVGCPFTWSTTCIWSTLGAKTSAWEGKKRSVIPQARILNMFNTIGSKLKHLSCFVRKDLCWWLQWASGSPVCNSGIRKVIFICSVIFWELKWWRRSSHSFPSQENKLFQEPCTKLIS